MVNTLKRSLKFGLRNIRIPFSEVKNHYPTLEIKYNQTNRVVRTD